MQTSVNGGYTMQINGSTEARCHDLGWALETVTRRNLAPDVLTLRRRHSGARTVAVDDIIVVYANGRRIFTGTARSPKISHTAAGAVLTVPVLGPWHHLDNTTFTRAEGHYEFSGTVYSKLPPEVGTLITISSVVHKWARVTNLGLTPPERDVAIVTGARGLLCDPTWSSGVPSYRTAQAQTRELIDYVLQTRDRLGLSVPFSVNLAAIENAGVSTYTGAMRSPRYRTFQDQRVGALVAGINACIPDLATWFIYDGETPELMLGTAALETETALALGSAPLMSIDASVQDDLRPAGICIRWEYPSGLDWSERGYKHAVWMDKSPVTCLPHEPGVITHTLDIPDSIADFKPDLAAALMSSLGVLRASGSVTFGGMSLDEALALRPGLTYRITGDEMLADAQLLLQETTWNASTNRVQAAIGYPKALDLKSLNDLRGWLSYTFNGPINSYTQLIPPP